MRNKSLLKYRPLVLTLLLLALLIACVGIFLTIRSFNEVPQLPQKIYLGEPATTSDLLQKSVDTGSINLMGKWKIESINGKPVLPAVDWLEKPAKTHLYFEIRDHEIILGGYSGCNAFGAVAYVLDDQVHAPELVMTQRGCAGTGMVEQENVLIKVFSSRGIWETPKIDSNSVMTVGNRKVGIVQLRRINQ